MISITIEFKGFFARIAPKKKLELETMENSSIKDVLESVVKIFKPKHQMLLQDALISRDGIKCNSSTKIYEGDRLVFLVPVVGGG